MILEGTKRITHLDDTGNIEVHMSIYNTRKRERGWFLACSKDTFFFVQARNKKRKKKKKSLTLLLLSFFCSKDGKIRLSINHTDTIKLSFIKSQQVLHHKRWINKNYKRTTKMKAYLIKNICALVCLPKDMPHYCVGKIL